MARFEVMYIRDRAGLDKVIEADSYRADGKFFTFLKNKEVIRSLKLDIVVQIKRLDGDDEGGNDDSEEGDLDAPSVLIVGGAPSRESMGAVVDDLIASGPSPEELAELIASGPSAEELIRDQNGGAP